MLHHGIQLTPYQTERLRIKAQALSADADATQTTPERFTGGPMDGMTIHVGPKTWAWCVSCFGVVGDGLLVMTYHRGEAGYGFAGVVDPCVGRVTFRGREQNQNCG